MESLNVLGGFFHAISTDPRISTTHIGVYASLLEYSRARDFANPIEVFSRQIMQLAKISSADTYYKCIRDLSRCGYIKYFPSFKNNKASKIFFSELSGLAK